MNRTQSGAVDLAGLKVLAEAAKFGDAWYEADCLHYEHKNGETRPLLSQDRAFIGATTPAAILRIAALVAQHETDLDAYERLCQAKDAANAEQAERIETLEQRERYLLQVLQECAPTATSAVAPVPQPQEPTAYLLEQIGRLSKLVDRQLHFDRPISGRDWNVTPLGPIRNTPTATSADGQAVSVTEGVIHSAMQEIGLGKMAAEDLWRAIRPAAKGAPDQSASYLGRQCQQERRNANLPSARTCDICGLGPCNRPAANGAGGRS
jgi:hypothetical protein